MTNQITDEKLYFECFQAASGGYLYEEIPDNWEELNEEDQLGFIRDHLWEPLEDEDPEKILSYIGCSADGWYFFVEMKIKERINKTKGEQS